MEFVVARGRRSSERPWGMRRGMSCAFKVAQIVHGSKVNQVCCLAYLHDFVDLGSQLVGYGVQGVAGSNPAVPIDS